MIRIEQPLTKQISLIFALLVTFSLFIGCGDEAETLKPSATTEGEIRNLVLLAPNQQAKDENLKVGLDYANEKEKEFEIEDNNDGTYTIITGKIPYKVNIENIGDETLDIIEVKYMVKCIKRDELEAENPEDRCKSDEVLISGVDAKTVDPPSNEVYIYSCEQDKNPIYSCEKKDFEPGETKEYEIEVRLNAEGNNVKLDELPARKVRVRNEVYVKYKILW